MHASFYEFRDINISSNSQRSDFELHEACIVLKLKNLKIFFVKVEKIKEIKKIDSTFFSFIY